MCMVDSSAIKSETDVSVAAVYCDYRIAWYKCTHVNRLLALCCHSGCFLLRIKLIRWEKFLSQVTDNEMFLLHALFISDQVMIKFK